MAPLRSETPDVFSVRKPWRLHSIPEPHHCLMAESESLMPDAKKAKTDTSVDVHTAEASAPAEQQLEDATGPSQQSQVQRMFGE